MANPLEEQFVLDNLQEGTVFEFGCSPGVFTSRMVEQGRSVTGIDLYEPANKQGYIFIQGNILNTPVYDTFDNVVCLSSFEHVGIESLDFELNPDITRTYSSAYYPRIEYAVARILSTSLLKRSGSLIITVPFGNNEIFFTNGNESGTIEEIKKPIWGFRTYSLERLEEVFGLSIIAAKAYGFVGEHYFERSSWQEVSVTSYKDFNNKKRGLLCAVLKRA